MTGAYDDLPASRYMDLPTAVSQIGQASDDARREHQPSPFFFLVGAGVSVPSVPLAWQIERDCQAHALGRGHPEPPQSAQPMDTYSYWFYKAFPHAEARRRYLEGLIKGKPISTANFHLARLLIDGRVARFIVTPNFDDFVARTLHLFGQEFIQYGYLDTGERVKLDGEAIEIIHVHGTYQFYDCRNLRREMAEDASVQGRWRARMHDLLSRVLQHYSPLVIGYSGWEEDVIMTTLRQRLDTPLGLGHDLYWFCHTRDGTRSMPRWLTGHPNVHLVVPDAGGWGGSPDRLTAVTIFRSLVRELDLPPPALASDPFLFLERRLSAAFKDSHGSVDWAVYDMGNVVQRLHSARRRQLEDPATFLGQTRSVDAGQPWRSPHVAMLHDAAREINNLRRSGRVGLERLRSVFQRARAAAAALATSAPMIDKGDAIAAYTDAVRVFARYKRALSKEGTGEPADFAELAVWGVEMLWRRGRALLRAGRSEEAHRSFSIVDGKFRNNDDARTLRWVVQALIDEAGLLPHLDLGGSDRLGVALGIYDDIVTLCGESSDFYLNEHLARALVARAATLREAEYDRAKVEAAYDEVYTRYHDSDYAPLRAQAAAALIGKGEFLAALKAHEDALLAADMVKERYAADVSLALRGWVARALLIRGLALRGQREFEAARDAYDEVVTRYGQSSEPELQEQVASALMQRGEALGQHGKPTEQGLAYDEVVLRYGNSSDRKVQVQVASALLGKGVLLDDTRNAQHVLAGSLVQALRCYQAVIELHERTGNDELQQQATQAFERQRTLEGTMAEVAKLLLDPGRGS